MAIVKFISENSCQIFVNMELVGEVQAGRMLKVSLETGSYLVEVKDAETKEMKGVVRKVKYTVTTDIEALEYIVAPIFFIIFIVNLIKE